MTERLQAMDQLWGSLNNRHGDEAPSPDWHQDFWLTGRRELSAEKQGS